MKDISINFYKENRNLRDTTAISEEVDGLTILNIHANGSEDLGGGCAPEVIISIQAENPITNAIFYKNLDSFKKPAKQKSAFSSFAPDEFDI